jgi:hypothetical protein
MTYSKDVFKLKPELVGKHPRLLFSQTEADARAILAEKYMKPEWDAFVNSCKLVSYPTNTGILGQEQWWHFSQLAIGIGLTKDQTMISKGSKWLETANSEEWDFDANTTVDLDIAHKLAGFALLYDCMYNYLSDVERVKYEKLLKLGLVKFRTHGYDIGDYWTNDYQNNHMHFRATASLYCATILIDKYPTLQSEADYLTTVWRRIAYMMPHDGSNHEGLDYTNYGGQMLYPGIYALRHCTDMDLTEAEHYHNVGYYYLHHVTPGMNTGFGFGDSYNSASSSGANYLFQIANFTQDPYIQYLANNLRAKHPSDFSLNQWYILFNDPLLKEKELTDLPLYRYFDDLGIVTCRSDWSDNATAVAFKCGPLGGKLLNETRGTEYSAFTDYVNVAHDDPDAGTFLLFSKGQFLTTGDNYEQTNKITTQHSTFIVDDKTQYGGGAQWSQPEEDTTKYAWQKDFFALKNRVVFSGDMKGVYPDMETLNRTFVSNNTKYIVIYDDARSKTQGRNFEWRLQTSGNLTTQGEKTYKITNGESTALARILSPSEADWSKTTNKSWNVLRARLSGQQQNRYLVIIWPNAVNLDPVNENINTSTAIGVKVNLNGNSEYTLFQKEDGLIATTGKIKFNGNTLLLTENSSDKTLKQASLVNGNSLAIDTINYFSADKRINFGIDSISENKSTVVYSMGTSSSTENVGLVNVTLGALSTNSTYFLFKNKENSGLELKTDAKRQLSFPINLEKNDHIILSKRNCNPTSLNEIIKTATDLQEKAIEGTLVGEYKSGSRSILGSEIENARNVSDIADNQVAINNSETRLLVAIETFKRYENTDVSVLYEIIKECNQLHESAIEGTGEGEYYSGSKATFKTAIDKANETLNSKNSLQNEIDAEAKNLIDELVLFQSKFHPIKATTQFSAVPFYGDFENYIPYDKTLWEVKNEEGNYIVGMHSISNSSGQYIIVKDSTYRDFELTFRAKCIDGAEDNDLMVVFGYTDSRNYSYLKLSAKLNESGVFTRIDGPTKYSLKTEDNKTFGVDGYDWNTYKIVSLNSVITVFRNDEPLFTIAKNPNLVYPGKIGIGTFYRNRAYFDDISVSKIGSIPNSINDLVQDKIIVYPIPSSDFVYVEIPPEVKIKKITVLDTLGKELNLTYNSNSLRIDVSNMNPGYYILKIQTNNGMIHKKFLCQSGIRY